MSDKTLHASDCSLHNMPAYHAMPCDCGATETPITDFHEFDRFPDDSEAERHMVVDSGIARQLERDNAKRRAEVEQMRQDVLEEAAATCEGTFAPFESKSGCCDAALEKAAKAIRALKAMQPVSSENDTVQKR